MRIANFKTRMLSGDLLAGTFIKTPSIEVIEVLAQSELDFVCLDAEHAPFDRARLDLCLAMARALDFPVLVRPGSASAENILQALDSGAIGIVAPHVYNVEKARAAAKAGHYGLGGRGYAGSSRWAGYATRPMQEVLAQDKETIIIAQIEEPEGVDAAADIAAVPGIDGLFLGPADLSVGYGQTAVGGPQLDAAFATVGAAAQKHGKAYMTFVGSAQDAAALTDHGLTMFFIASEQSWMRTEATRQAKGIHGLSS